MNYIKNNIYNGDNPIANKQMKTIIIKKNNYPKKY